MREKAELTREIVELWVRETEGAWFTYDQMWKQIGIETKTAKDSSRTIMKRLKDAGIVKSRPLKYGEFRFVDRTVEVIDWRNAEENKTYDIAWPFALEKVVLVNPKSLIVLAGAPNTGKTTFCHDVIAKNIARHKISLFSSEMGAEDLRDRLSFHEGFMSWDFEAIERSSGFADVIRPDNLNIIDYLEVTDAFYLVAQELQDIFHALKQGIALVTIQKKRNYKTIKGDTIEVDLGRGAEFGLEKPKLYLSMDSNVLKIVKGKKWTTRGVNPNGMKWNFKLVDGYKFVDIQRITEGGR